MKNLGTTTHTEGDIGKKICWVSGEITNPDEIRAGDDLGDPRLFSREELEDLQDISEIVRPILEISGWLSPVDATND